MKNTKFASLRLCERFKLNSAILDAELASAYLALKISSAVSRRNGIRKSQTYAQLLKVEVNNPLQWLAQIISIEDNSNENPKPNY